MSDPTGFLKYAREDEARRPVPERIRDFREFQLSLSEGRLREQGARCMDCGVPFCQSGAGCPVENRIPDWNELATEGRWREAIESLHATNNFPEFTGKLCPAPCESACILGIGADPVTIRSIESSIIERAFAEGWVQSRPSARRSGRSVAIVGSGPAGLAAAQQLARSGHAVTVFEKADRAGGLLRFGIPDFKMEKSILDRRLRQLEEEGVVFRTGVELGRDIALDELQARFDAVCLAVGAERPRDLPIPGREFKGVHLAMDYLTQQNRRNAGLPIEGAPILASGKRVIVLGGGDTGSDCIGTAHRQGAVEVRQFEILPQPFKLKTTHAHEEGGERLWSIETEAFLEGENGEIRGLRARDGRTFDAELIIIAAGFTGVASPQSWSASGVELTSRGTIAVNQAFETSRKGVFSAGDSKRGASLIVWAIAEGRKMASAVDLHLSELKEIKRSTV